MNCKSCNTRLPAGLRACPNCGRLASKPSQDGSAEDDSRYPLTESHTPRAEGDTDSEVDLELEAVDEIEELEELADEEVTEVAEPPPASRAARPAARKRAAKSAAARQPAGADEAPPRRSTTSAPASSAPTADEILELLRRQPEALEAGLSLYEAEGHTSGDRFATDVGEVDLLARDDAGGLVAIMVVSGRQAVAKQIVGETLQRVGWLSRHVTSEGQEVRAIVVVDSLPEEVEYAAAAVGDAIEFKTWRVSVRFDSLDL